MEIVRLLIMSAGFLAQMDLEANHHLYEPFFGVNLQNAELANNCRRARGTGKSLAGQRGFAENSN